MPGMNDCTLNTAASQDMQERAKQVLELTYQDWRLYEAPTGLSKAARRRAARAMRPGNGHDLSAAPRHFQAQPCYA